MGGRGNCTSTTGWPWRTRGPYVPRAVPAAPALLQGPPFTLLKLEGPTDLLADRRRWVLPVGGSAAAGGETARPGECLVIEAGAPLELDGTGAGRCRGRARLERCAMATGPSGPAIAPESRVRQM